MHWGFKSIKRVECIKFEKSPLGIATLDKPIFK